MDCPGSLAKMNDRVLIWITCRNYERFLSCALESAHEQTHPCAVYVSHDGCRGNNPVGTAANRNRFRDLGYAAHFDWVVFLDADDFLPRNYVEALLEVADTKDFDVIACDMTQFTDSHIIGKTIVRLPICLETLLELNTIHCSALIRARTLPYYDTTLDAFEDWDLWLEMAVAGFRFGYCPSTWLFHRLHADSRHNTKKQNVNIMRALFQARYAMELTKC